MVNNIEKKYQAIVELLSPIEIAAFYLGLVNLTDDILKDSHPRKHNVSGRASWTGSYHRLLAAELTYNLTAREPTKAKQIADELLLSQESALRHLGLRIEARLGEVEGDE